MYALFSAQQICFFILILFCYFKQNYDKTSQKGKGKKGGNMHYITYLLTSFCLCIEEWQRIPLINLSPNTIVMFVPIQNLNYFIFCAQGTLLRPQKMCLLFAWFALNSTRGVFARSCNTTSNRTHQNRSKVVDLATLEPACIVKQ